MCDSSGNDSDPKLLQSMVKISQLENSHMVKASFPDNVQYNEDLLCDDLLRNHSVRNTCKNYLC